MDFVANVMENTTVKNYENRSTFVKVMNECIVTVLLDTVEFHFSLYVAFSCHPRQAQWNASKRSRFTSVTGYVSAL